MALTKAFQKVIEERTGLTMKQIRNMSPEKTRAFFHKKRVKNPKTKEDINANLNALMKDLY